MGWGDISAADGFAIAMIGMIFLSLGVVGLLVFCMRRNACRRDHEVDDLLDEMAEDEKGKSPAPARGKAPKTGEPWEREADWWKN